MQIKGLKTVLRGSLLSLSLVSSLSAAGLGGGGFNPASPTPEEKTDEWRQEVLSTLKDISKSSQKRVRLAEEALETSKKPSQKSGDQEVSPSETSESPV